MIRTPHANFDPALRRILLVWALLIAVAASVLVVRGSARSAQIQAVTNQAEAVSAQAAGVTTLAFQEQIDLARESAENLLAGPITREDLERAIPLTNTLAIGVLDVETRTVLGIALPGYSDDETTSLDEILGYFPGAEQALQGQPIIGHIPNILPGLTLVSLFVPYTAADGSPRVIATGTSFDESIYAALLSPSGSDFTIQVTDGDKNLLLRSGPKVTIPDVVGQAEIPGTTWVVEARATWAQLGGELNSVWSGLPFTLLVAGLLAALIGWLAARAIRSAAQVEAAYEHVAWAAHQQGEFTAIIAHELRTPATSASGLAAFLTARWDALDPEQRRDLAQRVAASTQDLARLVSDLRLSRGFETGPISLAPTARRIGDIVTNAVTNTDISSADVAIAGDLDAMVIVDERFAMRALSSLIGNAAMHGAPPVEIRVVAKANSVDIIIRDNGEGVPDDFVPLLFEPFTQARSHLRRGHRGTGLGLHLVQAILEQMGGRVDYVSGSPGAVFTVHLPRSTPSPNTHDAQDPSASASVSSLSA